MNYGRIIPYDVGNGPGIRVSLFVSGCTNNCPGCFNQDAQDFNYGNPFDEDTAVKIIEMLQKPEVSGLSILGGDPMCQDTDGLWNLFSLSVVARTMGKSVWLWTGYTWEQLANMSDEKSFFREYLLTAVNVLVDGPFIEAQKDLSLAWRGSANQRIIDVQQSLERGEVVLWQTPTL